MAYDSFVLNACIRDIQQALPARINKIHQPDKYSLLLRYHGKNGSGKLLLCAGAEDARLHLTTAGHKNPAQAPLFLMVVRKWLEGATLQKVGQTPYERIAELVFSSHNELGDSVNMSLICEIMGKHSNIILLDENRQIIDGIRRYDSRLSRYREVLPQRPYLPPPPLAKALPPFEDEEALGECLLGCDLQTTLPAALCRQVAGISPWLARELTAQARLRENLTINELGQYELSALLSSLNTLAGLSNSGAYQPTLLLAADRPADFAAFDPLCWADSRRLYFDTMSEAVDAFYQEREQKLALERQRRQLDKVLRQHIARLERKLSHQRAELASSERGEEFKEAGDLLAAHLYQLSEERGASGRGLKEVLLPSFDEPQRQVLIKLDEALTPQQNIQRYYRKYNKCRKARLPIENHLRVGADELAYLQSIGVSIKNAALTEELGEIERELKSAGLLPAPPPLPGKNKKQSPKEAVLPPRRYLSADGFTILVGRNNRQNERLSLKIADPEDIWLHTQKIPGSHVIIVCGGKEVPDTTLTEAAAYAAWFSQAQDSPKVPVDYTRAAQVKKPQGAKPGMVVYFQQQTVYVKPRQPGPEQEE